MYNPVTMMDNVITADCHVQAYVLQDQNHADMFVQWGSANAVVSGTVTSLNSAEFARLLGLHREYRITGVTIEYFPASNINPNIIRKSTQIASVNNNTFSAATADNAVTICPDFAVHAPLNTVRKHIDLKTYFK
jgi:hypothetical protein